VNYSILYEIDGLRLNICTYSWEMALKVVLDVSFYNVKKCKGMRGKAGEVSSTKAYITHDENSR
jgi:hypothetical protein